MRTGEVVRILFSRFRPPPLRARCNGLEATTCPHARPVRPKGKSGTGMPDCGRPDQGRTRGAEQEPTPAWRVGHVLTGHKKDNNTDMIRTVGIRLQYDHHDFHKHKDQKNIPTRFHDESLFEPLRDGGSHRRCPSATQHVTPPAAVPTRDNADDGREGKDEQPPLPSITGGTLCASNGPLQNPQSEVLLIKNKPKTMHHKNQRIQKPGVV